MKGAAPREEEGSGSWFKAGTDGRKDTWDSQGEELTAIKQPRSLEVSTTIKNRDVCTWVSDLSSLESASQYGVSTLLSLGVFTNFEITFTDCVMLKLFLGHRWEEN